MTIKQFLIDRRINALQGNIDDFDIYVNLLETIIEYQDKMLNEIKTNDYAFKSKYTAELWAENCQDEVIKMLKLDIRNEEN